tara:strand:+ start:460 stop:594 length:135 start_codon:yes stop_codon:yes gene_type:complete
MLAFGGYFVYSQKAIANARAEAHHQNQTQPAIAQIQMTSNPGRV